MSLFFGKNNNIPSLMIFRLQNEHPNGIFLCWGGQGMRPALGTALQGLSTGWEQQHCCQPALDVPQDSKRGTATLFSRQIFCLQAGGTVWSCSNGKSCCIRICLESACFGGGPDKARHGFEGEREGPRGPPGVWRRGHPSVDNSPGVELITHSP